MPSSIADRTPATRSDLLESIASVPHGASLNGEVRSGLSGDTRTAVVHDWLPVYAGAERVLEHILKVLPAPTVYTLIDFVPPAQRDFLGEATVHTSFLQRLPLARSRYRYYLPLAPLAIEQFDLSPYEVIVSSSYVVAKAALTSADQFHLSYVHSPVRYAWDLHAEHIRHAGRGPRGLVARMVLHYLRLFDAVAASRVDAFVANSHHVARRVWKTYRRPCDVVHPPVDTDQFTPYERKDDYYVTVSRLVPYKRVDLIVEAFSARRDRELIVIGDGPELSRIRRMAGPNVSVLGYQPFDVVRHYLQRARAFVFAAEEDFGIAPVEAQACGTPVIALGRGGARESVIAGETGVFFPEQTPEALLAALAEFERIADRLEPGRIREHAEGFSSARFRWEFEAALERAHHAFALHGREQVA